VPSPPIRSSQSRSRDRPPSLCNSCRPRAPTSTSRTLLRPRLTECTLFPRACTLFTDGLAARCALCCVCLILQVRGPRGGRARARGWREADRGRISRLLLVALACALRALCVPAPRSLDLLAALSLAARCSSAACWLARCSPTGRWIEPLSLSARCSLARCSPNDTMMDRASPHTSQLTFTPPFTLPFTPLLRRRRDRRVGHRLRAHAHSAHSAAVVAAARHRRKVRRRRRRRLHPQPECGRSLYVVRGGRRCGWC
jgi:hypothetical protein